MSGNAALILAGIAGGGTGNALCYLGPTTAAAPTSAESALNVAFKDAGWCDESGLSEKIAKSNKDVKAFGASGAVRRLKLDQTETFDITFLESNLVTLAAYYEVEFGTLTADVDGKVAVHTGTPRTSRFSAVFETVDGDNLRRVYCPIVECERNDTAVLGGDAIKLPVTFTAYPDSTGVAVYRFWTLAALATP